MVLFGVPEMSFKKLGTRSLFVYIIMGLLWEMGDINSPNRGRDDKTPLTLYNAHHAQNVH